MNKEHAIADDVLDLIEIAISKGEEWMAYNNSLYFLDKEETCVFSKTKNRLFHFLNLIIVTMIVFKLSILNLSLMS